MFIFMFHCFMIYHLFFMISDAAGMSELLNFMML